MLSIKIIDAAFPYVPSMSAKGENKDLRPQHFEWYRGEEERDVCFFTDSTFQLAPIVKAKRKIAWLLEPPPFRSSTYQYVLSHLNKFDYVLTYVKDYIDNEKILFYPYGGSMIAFCNWGVYDKQKLCSIIVSEKKEATGHKLRHRIVEEFGGMIDVLGSGYGDYVDKFDALSPYAFSIVVEGERLDWCFDEKLIDCFATGTIPVFWGCPSISKFFIPEGILQFSEVAELIELLDSISFEKYDSLINFVHQNRKLATQYLCVEDWLWDNYRFLFL